MTTPRERLAKLLDSHQPDIDDVAATITNCTCGELLNDIPHWQNPYTNHLADAIIQAGWQQPVDSRQLLSQQPEPSKQSHPHQQTPTPKP